MTSAFTHGMKPRAWWCPACLRHVLTISTTAYHGDFCEAEGGPWAITQGIMGRPGRGAGSHVLHEPSCQLIQAERSVRRGLRESDKDRRRSDAITARRRDAAVRDEILAAPPPAPEQYHWRMGATRKPRAPRQARPSRGGDTP